MLMLESLPFPKILTRVPEYAGGHHERMDGKGYPRGLTREQMSVPARIMAVADIFEALTARDRPYKARKNLSECIDIMAHMSRDHHIDPDLFELFLTSGVYRAYAAKFLLAEQIDEVDIARHLGAPSAREAFFSQRPTFPTASTSTVNTETNFLSSRDCAANSRTPTSRRSPKEPTSPAGSSKSRSATISRSKPARCSSASIRALSASRSSKPRRSSPPSGC